MIRAWLVAILLTAFACGCGNAAPAKTAEQARADMRAAVVATRSAWMIVAQTCVDLAAMKQDEAYNFSRNAPPSLRPCRDDLQVADARPVNAWTDATSDAPLACKVSKALADVESGAMILGVKATALADAEVIVGGVVQLAGGCVDGGK